MSSMLRRWLDRFFARGRQLRPPISKAGRRFQLCCERLESRETPSITAFFSEASGNLAIDVDGPDNVVLENSLSTGRVTLNGQLLEAILAGHGHGRGMAGPVTSTVRSDEVTSITINAFGEFNNTINLGKVDPISFPNLRRQSPVRIQSGFGVDYVTGSFFDDYIDGGPGNDTLHGRHGADEIHGGDDNDTFLVFRADGFYRDQFGDIGGEDRLVVQNFDLRIASFDGLDIDLFFTEKVTNPPSGKINAKGIEKLDVRTLAGRTVRLEDNLVVETGLNEINILGGAGRKDVLIGPKNTRIDWAIDGSGAGSLKDPTDGYFRGTIKFSGMDRLEGGDRTDRFFVAAGGSIAAIDGGDSTGDDELNYSRYDRGVVVKMLSMTGTAVRQFESIRIVIGSEFGDTLNGSDQRDFLYGLGGRDTIRGNGGRDRIVGDGADQERDDGGNLLYGGDDVDEIRGSGGADVIDGGDEGDNIGGSGGHDVIEGGDGNDIIGGGEGNDVIRGGEGGDTLFGEIGFDILNGGPGNDILDGGDNGDTIFGGSGFDTLRGGTGDDNLEAGPPGTLFDLSQLEAYAGFTISFFATIALNRLYDYIGESLVGGPGNDRLKGSYASDTLDGGPGNDNVDGGKGNDKVLAGNGTEDDEDEIDGGQGSDDLYGGSGSTNMIGGPNEDAFFGGSGVEVAVDNVPAIIDRQNREIQKGEYVDSQVDTTAQPRVIRQ